MNNDQPPQHQAAAYTQPIHLGAETFWSPFGDAKGSHPLLAA